jgi:hypothetical protein
MPFPAVLLRAIKASLSGGLVFVWLLCAASAQTASGTSTHSAAVEADTPAQETRAIAQIKKLLIAQVLAQYAKHGRPAERDAHAKAQGCVKARFAVLPSLPLWLRVGVFARPATYTTWIRFSNAVGTNDHMGLARGMALKLTDVAGEKILPQEAHEKTQDFLLVNYPVFNVAKASDYVDFLSKSQSGQLATFFRTHKRSGAITAAIANQRVGNPLLLQYFSMTPYAFADRFVKYSARAISCENGTTLTDHPPTPLPHDSNYLRKAMASSLASGPSCFLFMIQRQSDARTMPIEDSTVLWNPAILPFVPVAKIFIPNQRFDSAPQQTFCENLSYTPWHSLPEHRPVGNINRIRRVVYDTISQLRHRLNGLERKEPTGNEHFEGGPTW